MENSIEEDIKILEELRIANENCIKNAKNKDNPFVTIWKKQNRALEHILSAYERVLKENEELNYKLHSKKIALEIYNRYIPKSKVEEKIEEIQKEYEETLKTANFKEIEKMNKINFRGITLEGQRSILRELLEKRK